MGRLNIVGIGPGSAEFVTPAARNAIRQAELIIGAQRSLSLFTSDIKGKVIILTAENLTFSLKQAAEEMSNGKNVALLSTGDPGFSGLLHTVIETGLFQTGDLKVIPGISSIQACAARLNLSWDNTHMFTFHRGHVDNNQKEKLVSSFQRDQTVILLPDQKEFTPKDVATLLIESGANRQTSVFICENLTLDNEKITSSTLGEIQGLSFGSLCVMVIKK